MKLSKKLRERNIKNKPKTNMNIDKPKILIKKKLLLRRNLKNRNKLIPTQNDYNKEESIQKNEEIKNNIFSDRNIDLTKEIDNSNEIYKIKTEGSDNINNSKNAPPIKLVGQFNTGRNLQKNLNNLIKEFSSDQNLNETKGSKQGIEEKPSNDLDMVEGYKGNHPKEVIDNIKNILGYNNDELNSMTYKEALKYDHRSFFEFYFAFLKSKHPLITIIDTGDYNSRIVKIYLIF